MKKLPELNVATSKLPPDRYQEMLGCLKLTDLTLESLTVRRVFPIDDGCGLEFVIEPDASVDLSKPDKPYLLVKYRIRGIHDGDEVMSLDVTFRQHFSASAPMSPAFFAIYTQFSAHTQTWPFLREIANNMTSRLGMPGLMLPLLTPTLSTPDNTSSGDDMLRGRGPVAVDA